MHTRIFSRSLLSEPVTIMERVTLIVALLAILASAEDLPTNSSIEFHQISASIKAVKANARFRATGTPELRNQLPGASSKVGEQFIYTIGHRVSGDRLVSSIEENQSWPTLQDVTQTISYPQSGFGAVVTYVQAIVKQSTNLGKAYVVAGGIGQRFLHMVIEAYSTSYFNYSLQIYGV